MGQGLMNILANVLMIGLQIRCCLVHIATLSLTGGCFTREFTWQERHVLQERPARVPIRKHTTEFATGYSEPLFEDLL